MTAKLYLRSKGSRRAAAMATALVVLLIVGMVSGMTLQAILRSHRQVREEEQRVQAELLADSAMSRAAAMLKADAAWSGEAWQVSLTEPEEPVTTGFAVIRVKKEMSAGRRQIFVTAIYPDDPVHHAQAVREQAYSLPQPGENK